MEKRNTARKPRRYVAWLCAGSATPPIRCYVEDVSPFGARLWVYRPLPADRFTLCFSRSGDAKVRCEVRWRDGCSVGVEFVSSVLDPPHAGVPLQSGLLASPGVMTSPAADHDRKLQA